jgi:hypothetical protein
MVDYGPLAPVFGEHPSSNPGISLNPFGYGFSCVLTGCNRSFEKIACENNGPEFGHLPADAGLHRRPPWVG